MPPKASLQKLRVASASGVQAREAQRHAEALDDFRARTEAQLKDAETQIADLEKACADFTKKTAHLQRINEQQKSQISSLKAELTVIANDKAALYRKWCTERQRCTRQEARIVSLSNTIAMRKHSDIHQGKQMQSVMADNRAVKSNLRRLEVDKQKLASRLELADELGLAKNAKYEASLVALKTKLAEAQKKASMLKKRDNR
ncbi:hypothetical protein DFP72DRAFT_1074151 [Ephemerocybe angulata]|uniref:Uncharacterized protein n=1 Tax=Ephemerocybe angulata TaxID=980116 RepID=A0A8H6LY97_9AGAR|nr:hypothetical protein DFP72DRAFT_1074151 [Tulosesus angulatus]